MSTSTSAPNGLEADVLHLADGSTMASWTRRPLRRLLVRLLRGVGCGSLLVELPNGERVLGRGAQPGPHAAVTLHRWRPLARMVLRGDIGLAESYRDGDWSSPDLSALLEFGIRNEAGCGRAYEPSLPARWIGRVAHRLRSNTRRGSRQNIAFHYDLGNAFYAQWLDPQMIYSSALYARGDETIEEAQATKLARIVELLELQPGSTVLEIGCGWGALALAMGGEGGAQVTGLTLSTEQLAHACEQVKAQGLEARIDLRLQDYRDVDGRYDRIVSIEMLEAVGERYWPVYFDTLRDRLADDGVAVVQVITIDEAQFASYRATPDFIQRFIFPGGMLPPVEALRAQAARVGLRLEVAESFGMSYAATLAEWRRRFLAAWPTIEPLGFDAAFKRLWEYYLSYCEAGFRAGRVDVRLLRLSRMSKAADRLKGHGQPTAAA
ncbi:SAM-dependent methyltransferase [Variovorax arabinosiphilus]|uniref:SAM-dependent methyltransferase n=1 Tax=Variovorax arabinosiphilus TaxID=3053498 RepID=UPI00257734B8|nr:MULTISPECIES: cyclopropane-fatty-acyl-phospholipid synthase family protein [unclassified Variovorax]MDM0118462.1 cyclopropane-fatty-acyl-phospholipid synthase family protein [Variovorax sp. J2L1-78]MDM0128887.1 cyclopropane-fatty-acyl-phospholipid synthase family protein [Variovorax sp. J2L1-63]MDM0233327.1 cyclopropane-fatty-acyl-phospholipid synthase family protein [Variovorax sp. J2R1-6]